MITQAARTSSARLSFTSHALDRISERVVPLVGRDALGIVARDLKSVMDRCGATRRAPSWLQASDKPRGAEMRFARLCIGGVRAVVVLASSDDELRAVTLVTERDRKQQVVRITAVPDGVGIAPDCIDRPRWARLARPVAA